jgi:hypothetical protein
VALWMLPALGLCALLGWRPSKPFLHGFFASGIGLTLGVVALVTMNLVSGRLALSSNGSVFLLARMLEDGTALSYLEQVCPQQRFAVCTYLDEIKSYNSLHPNSLSGYFLWGGILDKLGGHRAEEAEASVIVAGAFSMYPFTQFRAVVDNGWRQLLNFRTGDGLRTYPETEWCSITILNIFGSTVYDHYLKSKQIGDALFNQLELLNYIHVTVLVVSSLVLIGFFVVEGRQKRPRVFFACIFVIVLVVGNAFTLGPFSGPIDRYQSRVSWLVPLFAACIVLEFLPSRRARKQKGSSA